MSHATADSGPLPIASSLPKLGCAWKNFIVGLKTAWDQELSSGWMMSGQFNSFFCGFYPRWFEEDLGSEVVFWSVAHVHVHSHLPIPPLSIQRVEEIFTSTVGSTDQFDWFMDYFVGLFTSSLVSYTEKLRSMNSPVMHGAVPTQYELLLPFAFPAPTKSLRGFEEDSRSEVNLAFSTGTVISKFVPTVHAFDYMQKSSRNVYC